MTDAGAGAAVTGTTAAHPTAVVDVVRWIVLGSCAGVLAGVSSKVFLAGLDLVTRWREDGRQWLVVLLPLAGMAVGALYHHHGARSAEGSNLLLDEIHRPTSWVPRRMAGLVLVGTWTSHLFGASVGREGTALQMSGSLSDGFARVIGLRPDERRILLVAALAGGFGAVFGVPVAGGVFGLEVQALGRRRWIAIAPAFAASIVGDRVFRLLGGHHGTYSRIQPALTPSLLTRVAVAGVAFGVAGAAYPVLTHGIRRVLGRAVRWPPLRPFIGGVATIVLVVTFGHAYQGLSLDLATRALGGDHMGLSAAVLKLVFTSVAIGSGMFGGEVTPLFVIGATLGSALASPLGLPVGLIAAVGFCAVFAAAANTPLACIVLGGELFGWSMVAPMAVGCLAAYLCSSPNGIFATQRAHRFKLARWPGRRGLGATSAAADRSA